jgi:hypothetical protein
MRLCPEAMDINAPNSYPNYSDNTYEEDENETPHDAT